MNRAKAEQITDRILARMEQDGDGRGPVAHRESIIEEIIAGDALDQSVDIISTDADVKQKGVDAEIHALLLDAEKRASKLHAVLTDFTFPRIEPDRLPPSCVAVSAHEPALGEPLFINGDLVLSNFDALDLDDRDTA